MTGCATVAWTSDGVVACSVNDFKESSGNPLWSIISQISPSDTAKSPSYAFSSPGAGC